MDWKTTLGTGIGGIAGGLPGAAIGWGAGKVAGGSNPFNSIKGALLGGAGASTNPSDYNTPLPHAQQIQDMINRGLGRVENRGAPQLDTGPQDQFRQMQLQQAQQLQGIASGQQKGAGELAAERQAQNAIASQHALAQMRGAGGAGQLAAARQIGAAGSTAAGMGRQAALQDQAQAQQMLAGVTGQGRGLDVGIAGQNANLAQQQTGMNDQAYQAFLQSLLGMDQTQLQAQLAAMQAALGKPGLAGPLLSAGGQIAGSAIMASDERLKTGIRPAGAEVDALLAELRPFSFSYKDPDRHGTGPRLGVMAQHMGRSELGRSSIRQMDDGLGLDVNRALSLALASSARLSERVAAVESKIPKIPAIPSAMKAA